MNYRIAMKALLPRFFVPTAWVALAFALSGTGCGSLNEPASASFASVTIANHSDDEIAAATEKVFAAEGYKGGQTGAGEWTFDKEASRATTIGREGLVAAQDGAKTINRVRVEIISLNSGQYRLQCKAYMVTDGSLQDKVPIAHVRSGPYQALLNQVQKQLP